MVLVLLVLAVSTMVFGAVALVAFGRRRLRRDGGARSLLAFAAIIIGYLVVALALFDLLVAAGLMDHLDILGAVS